MRPGSSAAHRQASPSSGASSAATATSPCAARRARAAPRRLPRAPRAAAATGSRRGTLWIDSTEDHANASLRTALWRVQSLAPALVDRTNTHLALAGDIPVDAREIAALAHCVLARRPPRPRRRVAPRGRESAPARLVRRLGRDRRERLRQLCLHALEHLSAAARAQGRFAQATRGRARRRRARAVARERTPRRDRGLPSRGQRERGPPPLPAVRAPAGQQARLAAVAPPAGAGRAC